MLKKNVFIMVYFGALLYHLFFHETDTLVFLFSFTFFLFFSVHFSVSNQVSIDSLRPSSSVALLAK